MRERPRDADILPESKVVADSQAAPFAASTPNTVMAGTPVMTIDLDALKRNYRALDTVAANAECAGVVKALGAAGCKTFFVATLTEALKLRSIAPAATLYALNGLPPGCAGLYAENHIRPVLNSLPEIEEWAHYCADHGVRPPAGLQIDTGMMRLGLEPADVDVIAAYPVIFEAFELALVISHLACADEPEHPLNEKQLALFNELRAKLPEAPASLANSAGILLGPRYHLDLVRPGIALYGGRPINHGDNPMKPVIALSAPIAQVRSVKAGEQVGYGADYTLKRDGLIATLPVGYADGFSRALGCSDTAPGAQAYIDGLLVPVIGRVSMDLLTIDVTDIPDHLVHRGTMVELIGPHIGIDEIAERSGTISYEVLTSLGSRFHRVYSG